MTVPEGGAVVGEGNRKVSKEVREDMVVKCPGGVVRVRMFSLYSERRDVFVDLMSSRDMWNSVCVKSYPSYFYLSLILIPSTGTSGTLPTFLLLLLYSSNAHPEDLI